MSKLLPILVLIFSVNFASGQPGSPENKAQEAQKKFQEKKKKASPVCPGCKTDKSKVIDKKVMVDYLLESMQDHVARSMVMHHINGVLFMESSDNWVNELPKTERVFKQMDALEARDEQMRSIRWMTFLATHTAKAGATATIYIGQFGRITKSEKIRDYAVDHLIFIAFNASPNTEHDRLTKIPLSAHDVRRAAVDRLGTLYSVSSEKSRKKIRDTLSMLTTPEAKKNWPKVYEIATREIRKLFLTEKKQKSKK